MVLYYFIHNNVTKSRMILNGQQFTTVSKWFLTLGFSSEQKKSIYYNPSGVPFLYISISKQKNWNLQRTQLYWRYIEHIKELYVYEFIIENQAQFRTSLDLISALNAQLSSVCFSYRTQFWVCDQIISNILRLHENMSHVLCLYATKPFKIKYKLFQ